jgi:hypothetical protein
MGADASGAAAGEISSDSCAFATYRGSKYNRLDLIDRAADKREMSSDFQGLNTDGRRAF